MVGCSRLDEDPPALCTPPCSSRHLRDKLKRPLARAKIREMQAGVGVHDTDDRDIGEVESFGDHLRAEQDVHVSAGETLEDVMVRPLARGGVEVHAGDARARVPQSDEVLQLLCAQSAQPLSRRAAE